MSEEEMELEEEEWEEEEWETSRELFYII